MSRRRIGEILGQIVPLSGHDIEEILQEKRSKQCRFGEAAISLGLAQPEHVWTAWSAQLNHEIPHVDLDKIGIDMQAVSLLGREPAHRLGCVPIRLAQSQILVATSESRFKDASDALPTMLGMDVKFVIAPENQIQRALAECYPPTQSAA